MPYGKRAFLVTGESSTNLAAALPPDPLGFGLRSQCGRSFVVSDADARIRVVRASQQLTLPFPAPPSPKTTARGASPFYGVHAYHTKIPPEAIAHYIEVHTQPGDIVLDPFCGSGMTGVAAAMTGRRAILNDLSPAAVHIASNYVTPCDPIAFEAAVQRVLDEVGGRVAQMYATTEAGRSARLEYLVWSDVRSCSACSAEVLLWDVRHQGLRRITCPACGTDQPKADMPYIAERPVEANLSVDGVRVSRPPIPEDLGDDRIPSRLPWVPAVPFDPGRPMWRRGHRDLGIRTVADFYSRRNLAAMSLLWDAASRERDPRLRSALYFSLTAIANRASRRYQWNAKRPTNVLTGTLYVPSLRYEWNVLSLWRRKVAALRRMFAHSPMPDGAVRVIQGSAASLPLKDESVDYCFTDPPFGGHIVYSDASLLWEAWLGQFTDRRQEAIIANGGDESKTLDDYAVLLRASFSEVRRVLKPEGCATVIFQSTDPDVWAVVQRAASDAGLALVHAGTLDKGQPSFKQVKGRLEGERVPVTDIVLTFRKGMPGRSRSAITPRDALLAALDEVGEDASVHRLYAAVNARLIEAGCGVLSFDEVGTLLEEHDRRSLSLVSA